MIFFYSVQDNEREEIPNRTIMSYAFGSFTVPLLFIVIMAMLLDMLEKSMLGHAEEVDKVLAKQNPFFIWTYLLHHLEQVVLSNELVVDKMELTRRLLRAPFYVKEIQLRMERIWPYWGRKKNSGTSGGMPQMSHESMRDNFSKCIYQFYYGSLVTILQRMTDYQMQAERNKLYLVLYEFMEELTELYETGEKGPNKIGGKYRNNYMMTICGILNAVMDSGVEDEEGFCGYVFNNIVSRKVWDTQFDMYTLFQEYLYRTNKDAIRLDHLESIKELKKWKIAEDDMNLSIKTHYIYRVCETSGRGGDGRCE